MQATKGENKQDKFLVIYCAALTVTAVIFFLRYLNFSITEPTALDADFAVYYRAAGNLVIQHISPYFNPQTGLYYPYLYPPFFNLVLYPIGYLSYDAALALWLFVQAFLFVIAAIYFFKNYELNKTKFIFFACALPFILHIFVCGQAGLLTAAILLFGFSTLNKTPFFAGVIFALVMFKPQLGVALPIVFIARGNFKALFGFILSLVFMVAISYAVSGKEVWLDFFAKLQTHSEVMASSPKNLFKQMVSVYIGCKILGFSNAVALILHFIVAITAIFVIWYNFRINNKNAVIIFFAFSQLISPYIFVYDTTLISVVFYFLAVSANQSAFARMAFILGGFYPLVTPQIQAFGIPYASVIMIYICMATLIVSRKVDHHNQSFI